MFTNKNIRQWRSFADDHLFRIKRYAEADELSAQELYLYFIYRLMKVGLNPITMEGLGMMTAYGTMVHMFEDKKSEGE